MLNCLIYCSLVVVFGIKMVKHFRTDRIPSICINIDDIQSMLKLSRVLKIYSIRIVAVALELKQEEVVLQHRAIGEILSS